MPVLPRMSHFPTKPHRDLAMDTSRSELSHLSAASNDDTESSLSFDENTTLSNHDSSSKRQSSSFIHARNSRKPLPIIESHETPKGVDNSSKGQTQRHLGPEESQDSESNNENDSVKKKDSAFRHEKITMSKTKRSISRKAVAKGSAKETAKSSIREGRSTTFGTGRKKLWSPLEDNMLLRIMKQMLGRDPHERDPPDIVWAHVAEKMMTSRSAKQCRDRWTNHLRPGLKKGNWTNDEEDMIKQMHEQYGTQWTKIAKFLPERSENDIKNKYYSMMRRHQRVQERIDADMNAWAFDGAYREMEDTNSDLDSASDHPSEAHTLGSLLFSQEDVDACNA